MGFPSSSATLIKSSIVFVETEFSTNPATFKAIFFGPGDKILDLVKPSSVLDLRTVGLNERQIKALNHFQKARVFSGPDYQKTLSVTERTAQRDLKELIEKSFINKKGTGKGTQYYF